METIKASHFKTHFGAILDQAQSEPVKIERRGRSATVIIPEDQYEELVRKAARPTAEKKSALARLGDWADGEEIHVSAFEGDERSEAIATKHGLHWEEK